MKKKQHIAIVGAGIIGINCAVQLQAKGFQVTLLDKVGIGEGCSKANAAHFAIEQVFPLAEAALLWQLPKMLFDPLGPLRLSPAYFFKALPWFIKFLANITAKKRTKNIHALQQLNTLAIDSYRSLFKQANCEHLLIQQGNLLVFETASLKEITRQYWHYKKAGVAVKQLTREETLALEPELCSTIQGALYFIETGHTPSPSQINQTLAQHAMSLGATFSLFDVKKIHHHNNHVVLCNNEKELIFDKVLIATGAWSKSLLESLGYSLPLEAERGYSLTLNWQNNHLSPEGSALHLHLQRPVAFAERKFIITPLVTPLNNAIRLAGTVEFSGLHEEPHWQRADILLQQAQHLLTHLSKSEKMPALDKTYWSGYRPSLPDSLPVLGFAPNHQHIVLALGHQHLGLTQGAITGKLIAQLLSNEPTDIDLTPFSLGRFQ